MRVNTAKCWEYAEMLGTNEPTYPSKKSEKCDSVSLSLAMFEEFFPCNVCKPVFEGLLAGKSRFVILSL
jgi:hypothetical protein